MDEPEQTPEPAEEPSSPETTQGVESTDSPPWGDDFDPQKAWSTIQTQREAERELKQSQRELEEKWDDEQAHLAFLAERGYEVAEDEDPDPEYEDEEPDPTEALTAQEARLNQVEQEIAQRAFDSDLNELSSKAGVELTERDRLLIEHDCAKHGHNKAGLEKAFKEWEQWRKDDEVKAVERYRKSKQAPHVSQVGSSATEQPDLDDPQKRREWMTERYLQGQQQS